MQLAYLPCASCDHCLIKALVNEPKDVNMNIYKKFVSHGYALNAHSPDLNVAAAIDHAIQDTADSHHRSFAGSPIGPISTSEDRKLSLCLHP